MYFVIYVEIELIFCVCFIFDYLRFYLWILFYFYFLRICFYILLIGFNRNLSVFMNSIYVVFFIIFNLNVYIFDWGGGGFDII